MGRKPAENPKGEHIGIRVDGAALQAIDAEVERRSKLAGVPLGRSQVVRALVMEALAAATKKK